MDGLSTDLTKQHLGQDILGDYLTEFDFDFYVTLNISLLNLAKIVIPFFGDEQI